VAGLSTGPAEDLTPSTAELTGSLSYGADERFLTPGLPVIVSSSAEVQPEAKVGQTDATLQAQVAPNGRETTYQFEYGPTTAYGSSVPAPAGAVGSGEGPVQVPAAELSGLTVGATYHFRVVANNAFGTVDGPDHTFTTLAAALVGLRRRGDERDAGSTGQPARHGHHVASEPYTTTGCVL
jgi:hypothetical protein